MSGAATGRSAPCLVALGLGLAASACGSGAPKPRAARSPVAGVVIRVTTCRPAGVARGTVLIPGESVPDCRWFAREGFVATTMLAREVSAARVYRAASYLAEHPAGRRPVFAFGLSRGGSVAEYLALSGRVSGAIAVAAPVEFVNWWSDKTSYWRALGMSLADRRRASPIENVGPRSAPILLLHSPDDEVVPFSHSVRLHRLVANSVLRRLTGRHLQDPADVHRYARQWLDRILARQGERR